MLLYINSIFCNIEIIFDLLSSDKPLTRPTVKDEDDPKPVIAGISLT